VRGKAKVGSFRECEEDVEGAFDLKGRTWCLKVRGARTVNLDGLKPRSILVEGRRNQNKKNWKNLPALPEKASVERRENRKNIKSQGAKGRKRGNNDAGVTLLPTFMEKPSFS